MLILALYLKVYENACNPVPMSTWSVHTATDGRAYYYESESGTSTYERPAALDMPKQQREAATSRPRPSLSTCLEDPTVAALYNTLVRSCGAAALPKVSTRPAEDPLCAGGRGGAFCCASNRIYLCADHAWVGCRELAYELSHALNTCRGTVRCTRGGLSIDGEDCGYLSPPHVACSELRAAHWTRRCASRADGPPKQRCLEWHARWAVASCFPDD